MNALFTAGDNRYPAIIGSKAVPQQNLCIWVIFSYKVGVYLWVIFLKDYPDPDKDRIFKGFFDNICTLNQNMLIAFPGSVFLKDDLDLQIFWDSRIFLLIFHNIWFWISSRGFVPFIHCLYLDIKRWQFEIQFLHLWMWPYTTINLYAL